MFYQVLIQTFSSCLPWPPLLPGLTRSKPSNLTAETVGPSRSALQQRAWHCNTPLPAPSSVHNPRLPTAVVYRYTDSYMWYSYLTADTDRKRQGGTEKLYVLNTAVHKVRKSSSYPQRALQTASQLHGNLHLYPRVESQSSATLQRRSKYIL